MSAPRAVPPSGSGRRRWPFVALAALVIAGAAAIAAAPSIIAAAIERQLRSPGTDGGARIEAEHVALSWPGRLRVEGFRWRLAADAEPSVSARSVEVRVAPLRWLLGRDFLDVTLVSPRVVLQRRPDGTFDLIEQLWGNEATDAKLLAGLSVPVPPDESDEPTDAPLDVAPETRDAAAEVGGADVADQRAMDSAPWVRANDPFSVIGGRLTIEDGAWSIVDAASGRRIELVDVTLTFEAQKVEQVLAFHASARQRGNADGEGTIAVQGRLTRMLAGRFWLEYDRSDLLRAMDLDVRGRVAPCTVGDLDGGGEVDARIHDAHATARVEGTLNGGTVSFRLDARARERGLSPVGDLHLALQDVGLVPALTPLLAPINPIFDVGRGRLGGRLDAAWDGGWSDAPVEDQRVRLRGALAVRDLVVSEAPLVTSLLRAVGDDGDRLEGDLAAPEIRWEGGRVSYDRMTVTGRLPLTFAGTIADNGAVRLTCEVPVAGTSTRIPVVGWVDAPRLGAPASVRTAGAAGGP